MRTICCTPPLDKIACAKKIKSVGIRPRCVRVNHTATYLQNVLFEERLLVVSSVFVRGRSVGLPQICYVWLKSMLVFTTTCMFCEIVVGMVEIAESRVESSACRRVIGCCHSSVPFSNMMGFISGSLHDKTPPRARARTHAHTHTHSRS